MPDHTRRKIPAKSSLSLLFFRHASRFVIRFLHRNFVKTHEWASPSIAYAERGSAPLPPPGNAEPQLGVCSKRAIADAPSQTRHRRHPPHHDHRRIGVAVVLRTPFSTPSWGSAFPGGGATGARSCHPRKNRTYSHTYNKNEDLIVLFCRTTPPFVADVRRFRRENDHCNNSVTYAVNSSFLIF